LEVLVLMLKRIFRFNKRLLLLILLFMVVVVSLYREFVPDDAFIHMAYAKDLCEGKGYSFAGNKTYGSTSPLWPLLITACAGLNISLEHAARLLSYIFSIASILMMYYVTRLRFSVHHSLIASCLLCFNAYFMRWSLTGMEATAACFFMLVLIALLVMEKRGNAGSFFYCIIGVSPLVRPEFYLFLPAYFIFLFFTEPKKKYAIKILFSIIPVVMWNCFAYMYFGTIVPTTFSVKAGDTLFSPDWEKVVRSVRLFLSGNLIEFCVILLAAGLIVLHNRHRLRTIVSSVIRTESLLLVFWIVSFYGYYILKNVTILSRYSLVLLPPIILLMMISLTRVCDQYRCSQRQVFLLVGLAGALSVMVHGFYTYAIVKPDADSFVQGFQREYKKIASIISSDHHTEGSVIVSDVGMIGFYSGLRVCDFVGLVDQDRSHFSSERNYFLNKKPHYLISRGEVTLEELRDTSCSFEEIYATQIDGFGINHKGRVSIKVLRISWK
jgi:hypothetical protein